MERIRHPDYLTDEGFEVAKVLVEKEAEITNPEAVQPPEYTFEKREGVDLATEVKGTRQTPIPDIFFEKSLLQTFYVYANPAAPYEKRIEALDVLVEMDNASKVYRRKMYSGEQNGSLVFLGFTRCIRAAINAVDDIFIEDRNDRELLREYLP